MAKTLVVLGAAGDPAAPVFSAAWQGEVLLMTPRDLSRPGWHLAVGDPAASVLCAGGRRLRATEITGIIIRIGWVAAADLVWIAEPERDYVAAEMSAFLLAFLDQHPSPVLNRPSPICLAGPLHRPAVWRTAAAKAGLALAPEAAPVTWRINVIDGICLDAADPSLAAAAVMLANMVGAATLVLEMAGDADHPLFSSAHPFADLTNPALAAAALASLR